MTDNNANDINVDETTDDTEVVADTPDSEDTDTAETFPRAYVEKLRDENAKYRQRAGRTDEAVERLLAKTVHLAASDVLADPGDLLTFTDTASLLDADGWPDDDAIRTAAEALAATKPHLAPRRPRGDIGQGVTATTGTVNLAELMKARA